MKYNKIMTDTIFTKIIKGEIPSCKVHEDEKTYALMDIYPIQEGQVLVVPKEPANFVWDMNSDDYAALMATVQEVGKRLREAYPHKKRIGVIIEGLDVVDHAHVKVFPFDDHDEFCNVPDHSKEPDYETLDAMAKKLAF